MGLKTKDATFVEKINFFYKKINLHILIKIVCEHIQGLPNVVWKILRRSNKHQHNVHYFCVAKFRRRGVYIKKNVYLPLPLWENPKSAIVTKYEISLNV